MLIPTKSLPEAKSRLLGAVPDHARLVLAIRADTIAAARAAAGVARIVVVTDRPAAAGEDRIFVQAKPGLNAALDEAAVFAAANWPQDGIAALVGDLPALRPPELADALTAAANHPHAYVPDHIGMGTTLLTAAPQQPLQPSFGAGSAARHAGSAAGIAAGAGLRADVDTAADLAAAITLGVGPETRTVLSAHGAPSVRFDSA